MNLLHIILGRTCIFCGNTVDPSSDGVCKNCAQAIAERHLEILPSEQKDVLSLFRYEEPLRHGLHRFKYNGVADLGKYCARLMAQRIRELDLNADLITCVPRAKDGLPRMYNQSEMIARPLAKQLNLPFNNTLLRKRSGAKSQTECINAHARLRNAQKAFRKGFQKIDLHGKRILLVDDLYTTGATTQTCSELLKKMGAESVLICTAMRVCGSPSALLISNNYTHLHFDLKQERKKGRYIPK